ncbi:hypothetical protein ACIBSR_16735 [Streptomyces sp. NPDC049936]|uniref:hypothetical protein n=1 Tax=Streptomyces sp. NPDC049936 TaxID=3365599 RepID=UPI0037A45D91
MKWWRGLRKPAEAPAQDAPADTVRTSAQRGVSLGKRAVDADGDLGVVVTGDHNSTTTIMGDVIVNGASKAPLSVYEAEIRILAATHFEGREKELAEMSTFALGDHAHGPSYWRWLAPAWSGKTALMAQFALNPPDGVHVLAFFITARLAGRSDRTAFLSMLQQQLRAYLEDSDLDCDGYGGFHDALRRAAQRALGRGQRLVLVVDGMDEDSGVESAFAGYSIAGLLPANPPDGLRVIVAGRPNPPVPGDVPHGHPLRASHISHDLAESPAARAVREDAERNLNDMIVAGDLSLDLVGLTSAAGGGLSAADYALLVGDRTPRQIEAVLSGATGRSFQLRPAQWPLSDGRRPSLYSFAHQELVVSARHLLRPSVLSDYRTRVHDLIDAYQERGWPQDTPEYALKGYPQMLREQRDTARLTRLATDPARHERLWHTTGSDTEALTEIADAFTLHRAEPEADLVSCVRLSYFRDELKHKALSFPAEAITVLAKLGHIRKAAALLGARVEFSAHECRLFANVVREALLIGEEQVVLAAAHALVRPAVRDQALRSCVEALASAEQIDAAAELARTIGDVRERNEAFVEAVRILVKAGRLDRIIGLAHEAAETARVSGDPVSRIEALTSVVEVLAEAGWTEEAACLATEAVDVVHALTESPRRAWPSVVVADALMVAGRPEEAVGLARSAASGAESLGDMGERARVLHQVAYVLAKAGRQEEAVRWAQRIDDLGSRCAALIEVAEALAEAELAEEAVGSVRDAAEAAEGVEDLEERAGLLAELARELAKRGRGEEGLRLARTIPDPQLRFPAVLGVLSALVKARLPGEAIVLVPHATEAAGDLTEPERRADALRQIAQLLVTVERPAEAARLTASVSDPEHRATAWSHVALTMAMVGYTEEAVRRGLAAAEAVSTVGSAAMRANGLLRVARVLEKAGRTEESAGLARRAAEVAATINAPQARASALVDAARALADTGEADDAIRYTDLAIEVARTAPDIGRTVSSTLQVARALAQTDRAEEATGLARTAVDMARTVEEPGIRAGLLGHAALSLAETGQAAEAVQLTDTYARVGRGHIDPDDQARVLANVAGALAKTGRAEAAVRLAQTAADLARTTPEAVWRSWALANVAETLAEAALADESIRLAETVTEPDDRAMALAAAARALIEAGRRDEAVRLAHTAIRLAGTTPNASYRVLALSDAARALVAVGEPGNAAETVECLTEDDQAMALANVAGAMAAVAGELAHAEHTKDAVRLAHRAANLARTTPNASQRAATLAGVAKALARAGHLDQAAEVASTITEPSWCASALAALAQNRGCSPEARSLLRWALSLHSHEEALKEIATVCPEALDEALSCVRRTGVMTVELQVSGPELR